MTRGGSPSTRHGCTMLPDQYRQLLTAYVDGELSGRQRRHVVRLLKRSRDARQLLRRLQEDSTVISGMTAPKLDIDLSASVVQAIRERGLRCVKSKKVAPAPSFPAWIGIAVAASVLCAIGAGSYFGFAAFFPRSTATPTDNPVAKNAQPQPQLEPPKPEQLKPDQPIQVRNEKPEDKPPVVVRVETPSKDPIKPPVPNPPDETPPPVVVKVPKEPEQHGPPSPEVTPRKEELLTNPTMEIFKPEMVESSVKPVIVKLHDLDQDTPRKKLSDELTKDTGFRVELPCDNGTRAFDRLKAVCKEQKIEIQIDQKAQLRLKTPQAKTNYVLYIENVTPEELARLVQQLGAEDKKAAAKKPSEAHFVSMVVTRLTKRDYKELSDLLGVDPSKVEPPKATGPFGTDLSKPLSEQTAEEVAKALEGNKTAPKTAAAAHQALVLAYNPVLPPKNSPEVKHFLEGRKPAKPGTVRAIIVLRSM